MKIKIVSDFHLQVGQWVQFTTNKDSSKLSEKQLKIYSEDRLFLVATREDSSFDTCRCELIDNSGRRYDYSPRGGMLEGTFLVWNHNILAVPAKDVEEMIGEAGMQHVYAGAQKRLDEMKDSGYLAKHRVQTLDVAALLKRPEADSSVDSDFTLRIAGAAGAGSSTLPPLLTTNPYRHFQPTENPDGKPVLGVFLAEKLAEKGSRAMEPALDALTKLSNEDLRKCTIS